MIVRFSLVFISSSIPVSLISNSIVSFPTYSSTCIPFVVKGFLVLINDGATEPAGKPPWFMESAKFTAECSSLYLKLPHQTILGAWRYNLGSSSPEKPDFMPKYHI